MHEYVRRVKKAEVKLLRIPDGEIVIPGTCKCKHPDPIKVGGAEKEFYVCCFCGRVRLPDNNGNVPVGPTACQEMGKPYKPPSDD